MGFRIGDISEQKESGIIKGIQREIACYCWFTSTGRAIPKEIKILDDMGIVHRIKEIQLLYTEEKQYAGIESVEHVCKINLFGMMETVKLIYVKETCKWTMVRV